MKHAWMALATSLVMMGAAPPQCPSSDPHPTPPPPGDHMTTALIWSGPGVCPENCAEAAGEVAKLAGLTPVYVNSANSDTSAEREALFRDAAVWIQPGGTAVEASKAMGKTLKSALKQWIADGGGYVGFCAGAYLATWRIGTSLYLGLGIMPGSTKLYPETGHYAMQASRWRGTLREMYWEGGPFLHSLPDSAEAIATYPNGSISAARAIYGRGRVFVSGQHPEAPQSWRTYYGMTDSDDLDLDLGVEMVNWARRP